MNIRPLLVLLLTMARATTPCLSQKAEGLIPDYAGLQYAGSTGWIGLSTGYDLFKHRLRAGMQYGYVPASKGGSLHILSASVFYKPFRIKLSEHIRANIFDIGAKASYQFGDQYFISLPSRYPKGYYWWKSALRWHLATESSVTRRFVHAGFVKSATAYLEFNSNDLYMVSYILNTGSLSVSDVVKAGLGVRFNF